MPKLIDLTGQRFGKLTVVKEHGRKNSIVTWECHCDCGAVTIVKTAHLRSRYTFSCGCLEDAEWGDLTGQKFGKLTVISKYERGHSARVRWLCQCECGKIRIANSGSLQNGNSKSCGCDRVKMRRHGMTKTPEYYAWANMIHRCTNPNNDFWKDYGGRGISVCERWRNDFLLFLEDMGKRPEGMTLDRIDVNGNYEPTNCRWATIETQNSNRRNARYIQLCDERVPVSEYARRAGVHVTTVRKWLKSGKLKESA